MNPPTGRQYDSGRDGNVVFLIAGGDENDAAVPRSIAVVLNWFDELEARVPVP